MTVGGKVVYPGRGPCLIGGVVQKVVCGRSASFYRLALLDDSKAELFVPVDNSRDLPVRALLDRSEIPKLLGHLKPRAGVTKAPGTAKNWRQRELDNLKLFSSGSIFELANMVEVTDSVERHQEPGCARAGDAASREKTADLRDLGSDERKQNCCNGTY